MLPAYYAATNANMQLNFAAGKHILLTEVYHQPHNKNSAVGGDYGRRNGSHFHLFVAERQYLFGRQQRLRRLGARRAGHRYSARSDCFRSGHNLRAAHTQYSPHVFVRLPRRRRSYCLAQSLSGIKLPSGVWRAALSSLCAAAFCLFYACTDEFHQYFVPGRSAALRDVMFDVIGSASAIVVIFAVHAAIICLGAGGRRSKND